MFNLQLIINSLLLGVGLAMDAFSVSIANGISDPSMRKRRMFLIAGTFAVFQFIMPLGGWVCVHTIAKQFTAIQPFIPWIAFVLLLLIGGSMIREGALQKQLDKPSSKQKAASKLKLTTLLIQGVATSIDALSVGFAIESYFAVQAIVSSLIIGVVTMIICLAGLLFGKRIGNKFQAGASIVGGLILIAIGAEILIKSFL